MCEFLNVFVDQPQLTRFDCKCVRLTGESQNPDLLCVVDDKSWFGAEVLTKCNTWYVTWGRNNEGCSKEIDFMFIAKQLFTIYHDSCLFR